MYRLVGKSRNGCWVISNDDDKSSINNQLGIDPTKDQGILYTRNYKPAYKTILFMIKITDYAFTNSDFVKMIYHFGVTLIHKNETPAKFYTVEI